MQQASWLAMHRKVYPPLRKPLLVLTMALIVLPLAMVQATSLQLTSEYNNYVHTYLNTEKGNYTRVEKPIFPVMINNSQIQIGTSWSIICPLQANHNYHVYCYGAWVNISSAAKTDYDIYVYDPQNNLESSHTEAAGLPEHLGTTTNDQFFTPKQSGDYTFVIKNDAKESMGNQQITFMIIENLECDKWYTKQITGKGSDNQPSQDTIAAYEFTTNDSKAELYVKVPQTLDMYEARLYLMNNAKSLSINNYPLPWEPGLYGNVSVGVGGYNFESEGYRGVAYASCEYPGQDMFLNYTSASKTMNLYHLVLMGEEGQGSVEFMLKTHFDNSSLVPQDIPRRVYPGASANVSFASDNNSLETAELSYTNDNWTTSTAVDMVIDNRTCSTAIPEQAAGTLIQYRVDAYDIYKNKLTAIGNYTVKQPLTLNITAAKETLRLGENITIAGTVTPTIEQTAIIVQFNSNNSTKIVSCNVTSAGTFTASLQPDSPGLWSISAMATETPISYTAASSELIVTVTEPPIYIKYSMFIIGGLIAALAAGGVVYYLKFRGR